MANIDVGDSVRITVTITVNGTPTDPSTIVGKVKDSAGTVTNYTYGGQGTIQKSSTGVYYMDFIPVVGGRHHYRWQTTGTAVGAHESLFDVEPTVF